MTDQVSEHVKFCSEMDNSGAHAMWDLNLHFTMGDANPTFGSTWVSSYSYTGGAHPNTVYKTFNIGLKNNRPVMLTINDLTGGDAQKMSGLEAKLVAELRYRKASSVEADPNFKLDPKLLNNFVVTPAGATWLFSPYEVASYAEGPFFVKFSRTEMRPYIDQNGPFGFIAK